MIRALPFLVLFIMLFAWWAWINSSIEDHAFIKSKMKKHALPVLVIFFGWAIAMAFMFAHTGGIKLL